MSSPILFEKSLYDQCRRTLRSAEKLASKHELSEIVLIISKKQKRLLETLGYLEITDKELGKIQQADQTRTQVIRTNNDLWMLKSSLFRRMVHKGIARSPEERTEYQKVQAQGTSQDGTA